MYHFLLPVLLLLSLSAPLYAEDVWTILFNENLEDAESGDPDAEYEVGIMYLKGQGVSASRDRAIEWLQAAAGHGNEQAEGKLLRMEQQHQAFVRVLQQAEKGDLKAQYETGLRLLSGKGVQMDAQLAVKWLGKAADRQHEKAILRLAILYFKGRGVQADPARAVRMLQSVADKQVLAQYYLGEAYAKGKGVTRDYQQALAWYRKADQNGYKRASGKMINVEEEIRMQARREARLAREQAQREAQLAKEQAQAAQQAREKEKRVRATTQVSQKKKKVVKKVTSKRKPEIARQAAGAAQSHPGKPELDLAYLLRKSWESKGRSINFLPSSINQCETEKNRLVCYSHNIQETSAGRNIKYRVKSIITPGKQANSFHVMYRNLVLEAGILDTEVTALSYDDEQEQGYQVKTGWTGKHEADCNFDSAAEITCLKDGVHRIHVVAARGGMDRQDSRRYADLAP